MAWTLLATWEGARVSEGGGGSPRALDGDLAAARAGNPDAFGRLYEAYGADVARLCKRLLGGGAEAEDACSETFLRAHGALERYDPAQAFRPWLLAVAAHHCIDRLRRRAREGRLFAEGDLDPPAPGDGAPEPLRAALDAEARRRLLAAIDALPDRDRAPLVLRYFAELSYDAIGEALGVGRAQVGTLLYRAKARLRARVREEEDAP